MENASKALLISAGILIVMLVVTLLIFGWRSYSDYFFKKQELENIDNLAKFNEQFESYERDDVMGYELLSLANKVADYNERYSNDPNANNDQKYTPITLIINIDQATREKMTYDNTIRLFKINKYEQSNTKSKIKDIIDTAGVLEEALGKKEVASKVAKNIRSLVYNEVENYYKNTLKYDDNQIKEKILKDFNAITGLNLSSYNEVTTYIGSNGEKIYSYYEYYQFKRMKFKCEVSNIKYDDVFGRISYMEFTATGEIE